MDGGIEGFRAMLVRNMLVIVANLGLQPVANILMNPAAASARATATTNFAWSQRVGVARFRG